MSVSHAGGAPTPAHCTPPAPAGLAQCRWSGGRKRGTRCSLSRTCKCIPASFPPVTSKGLPPQMCMKIQQQVQTHKNANVKKMIAVNWRATIYVWTVVFFNNVFQWVNDRATYRADQIKQQAVNSTLKKTNLDTGVSLGDKGHYGMNLLKTKLTWYSALSNMLVSFQLLFENGQILKKEKRIKSNRRERLRESRSVCRK